MRARGPRHSSLAVAVTVTVLGALTACDRTPSSASGRFVYPLPIEPTTLNFVTATDIYAHLVTSLVGDGLVDHDAALRPVPRLARAWEFSPDGRLLTFHLRPEARFHDGRPVTGADVRFTWQRAIDPKSRAPGRLSDLLPVAAVDVPDPHTVVVTYRAPYAPALSAWEMPILPRHLYEGEDFATSRYNRAPIGSGPFRFQSWEAGRRIVLTANDDWWGGRPRLDTVVFAIVPSPETALRALLAGEVDYAGLTPAQWDSEGSRASFTRRFRPVRFESLYFYYIAWRGDGRNPFFGDAGVRRALSLAIDRGAYVRNVLRGNGRPTDSLYHPAQGIAAGTGAPVCDPAAAARLLDEAGWRIDPGTGRRARAGRPFRFTLLIYAGAGEPLQIAQVVQESLRRLGVDMSIERLDWPSLWSRLKSGAFDAALSGTLPDLDPDAVYGMLHSSQIDGGQNYAAFRDAQVDAWLDAARATLDPPARRALYETIDRRVRELAPYAPLFHPVVLGALSRRVGGLEPSPRGLLDPYPGLAGAWADAGGT
jgi:peptide/nickel transport system substrate-binding protein